VVREEVGAGGRNDGSIVYAHMNKKQRLNGICEIKENYLG
jgi:hypothetical protein